MYELLNWKVTPIRYRGLKVSIHLLFLVFAVYVVVASFGQDGGGHFLKALTGVGILLASVALHEVAHLVAARSLRGDYEELILWPLGGLTTPTLSPWGEEESVGSQEELLVAAAGPTANLVICLLTTPLLLVFGIYPWQLINILELPAQVDGPLFSLALVFWINGVLTIANLLPAFPMDGARMLRAGLRRKLDYDEATLWTVRVAIIMAMILLMLGLLLPEALFRVPLGLTAVLVYFASRNEVDRRRQAGESDTFMGYDFSQGYTSLERADDPQPPAPQPAMGPVQRWLYKRRQQRQERQRQKEIEEERRFDEILERIHQNGMHGITAEERDLLDRVSKRIRSRLEG